MSSGYDLCHHQRDCFAVELRVALRDVEEYYPADCADLRSGGLGQRASNNPETQVVMADFGLERIAVSDVEQRDACAVP